MAIVESLTHTAIENLRLGNRDEAEKMLRDACRMDPSHIRSHCVLATLIYQDGDTATALSILDRFEADHPDKPEIIRARAEVLLGSGELEAALEVQTRARQLNPRDPHGYLQEGIVLERLGRHAEAEECIRQALYFNPNLTGALQVLGTMAYRAGRLHEAADVLNRVRVGQKPGVDPHHHQARALFALGAYDHLMSLAPALSVAQRHGETVMKAIAAWCCDQPEVCAEQLIEAIPLANQSIVNSPNRAAFIARCRLLDTLVKWRHGHPDSYGGTAAAHLHVIGDGGVLPIANLTVRLGGGVTRLSAYPVLDGAAADFTDDESDARRATFDAMAGRVPQGADVLAVFGERDCRLREGIMPAVRKDPDFDWKERVDTIVGNYVTAMSARASERGWSLRFVTPPMTNINVSCLPDTAQRLHLGIHTCFHDTLAAAAAKASCGLVDLKACTTDDAGHARHARFIDANHVWPSTFVEALEAAG
ncbi:MAG: tetratricopeptide repeat protein [Rhodospirillales bacterium]|nr:tetratricopeptide repeat protein [Rhodospirillales bacterium]